jgi:single-strand DNA-binding protein
MSNEVSGVMKVIMDEQTYASGFSKREFVITTNETYPQDIKLEFVKDKCSLLDKYPVGSNVNVSYNLRGNEYEGKYYVNLQAWRVEAGEVQAPQPHGQPMEDLDEDAF